MKRTLSQFLLLLCINLFAQVGIGTTNPLSTLDVNGSVSANINTTTGNLTLNETNHTIILGVIITLLCQQQTLAMAECML
jgi:hypothetical protein